MHLLGCNSAYRLRYWNTNGALLSTINCLGCNSAYCLQYWTPLRSAVTIMFVITCNSTYRLWYWNWLSSVLLSMERWSCNSTYRLRYAPKGARQQRNKVTMRSAHLKYQSKAKVKRRWLGNGAYRLRYWNQFSFIGAGQTTTLGWNSTYCLWYWNFLYNSRGLHISEKFVATVLTVYGIETLIVLVWRPTNLVVATAPTIYGIETLLSNERSLILLRVATAPTVYGIETYESICIWVIL